MCGIAGILDWDGAPPQTLDPMLRSIRHRGPDDEGRFVDGPVALGMRRLSIIDVAGGHQPVFNEDESVVVVYNGEIYNYLELRQELEQRGHRFATRTDTEVLVHLYEDRGPDLVTHLNGMFAFALWDRNAQRLVIARDRLGVKPLYYAETPRGLVFASELKALMATGRVSRDLDHCALFEYLIHYYIPGELAPFRDVKKLLPGHLLVAGSDGLKVRQWWDLTEHVAPEPVSRADATDRVRELFLDSIRLRMRSDVPVGAYLSGGLDSSLTTVAAARQTDIPINTFNVTFERTQFDESPYARAVAEHAGTNHHEITVSPDHALDILPKLVWHLDEPNGDSAVLPTYLVSELAARHVKVALSGIGADELFGGYPRYHARLGKFDQLALLPTPMLRLLRPILGPLKQEWAEKLDRMVAPPAPWRDFLQKTHRFDERIVRSIVQNGRSDWAHRVRQAFERYPGADYVNQRMYADAHTYLPDQILLLTDRMSMAPSLEARTPFLDYRLVEFVTGLPGDWKVRGPGWKLILKDALGDLVPGQILSRPKWGFASPVESWLHGKYLDVFLDLCRSSELVRDGHLDRDGMDVFLSQPNLATHWGPWLWAMAMLELWYRVYSRADLTAAPHATLAEFTGAATVR